MKIVKSLFFIFFNIVWLFQSFAQTQITKEDYLKSLRNYNEGVWKSYNESLNFWQKNSPNDLQNKPRLHLNRARVDGLLYSVSGEKIYAEQAKKILLESDWSDNYYIIMVLNQIKKSNIMTDDNLKTIEKKIIEGTKYPMNFWAEWGTMNHCSNYIINSLTATIQFLPDHTDVAKWKQKRDISISSNWGLWSIEDSQIYISVWLKPMIQYAELSGREKEFFGLPMTKYYFDYLVQLMTPEGQIAEFGDGGPSSEYTWTWAVSVLEKGASIYRDGKMKWAAHRIFQACSANKKSATDEELVEAYLWADDNIKEEIPKDRSRLVLEDYVGKKIVFRNGWEPQSTFLFLNYFNDAQFGIEGKEHIINTINVETEKNHHGHADENAICSMMKDGSYLLHDAGYRESSSTGPTGEFRADIYHNKLIVRNNISDSNTRLLPALLNEGRYHFVDTKLMHFKNFKEADISRTRLIDQEKGYEWDRLLTYLKDKEIFVVFDIVKILRDGPYTLSNLFYSQNIASYDKINNRWYDTYYSTITGRGDYVIPNIDNSRLLIYFPDTRRFRFGAEQIRRSYQTEWAIYQSRSDSLKKDDILVFTTLLIPHQKNEDPNKIAESFSKMKIYNKGNGYGIKIPDSDGYLQINAMLNLEKEYLKENIRPRYNFESGKNEYGDLISDARYCYLHNKGNEMFYSFFKASKLIFNNEIIFNAGNEQYYGQDNGVYRRDGVTKWIAWEDKIILKNK
jgi:hypothetical protein